MHKNRLLSMLLLATSATAAAAADFPSRPLTFIQGFAPGGQADTIARIVGQEMSKGLGQPVVVEAKPGAGGTIAADFVAKASADGHTWLMVTGAHPISAATYKKLSFDPVKSFQMVSTFFHVNFVIAVPSGAKANTIAALIAEAKKAPSTVTYGSAGVGTGQHLATELLAYMAGATYVHVPYKGEALALTALMTGETQFSTVSMTVALGAIRAGKIKAIATTGKTRWPGLPDVPTAAETVPGYEFRPFLGLAVTAGTPREIVSRLNAEVVRALSVPGVRNKIQEIGGDVAASTPEEMRDMVVQEIQRATELVRLGRIASF